MTTSQLSAIARVETALPDPPDHEVFTPDQWKMVLAMADTIVPEIRPSHTPHLGPQLFLTQSEYAAAVQDIKNSVANPPDDAVIEQYLAENATSNARFRRELQRIFAAHVRDDVRSGVGLIISMVNSRVGSLIFNGSSTPFYDHAYEERAAIMKSWSQSYLPPLRQVHRSLSQLVKVTWLRTSPSIAPLLSFPRVPIHMSPGTTFPFEFVGFQAGEQAEIIETDVVVVGSGCGAGVVAKNIAEDGHRVVVVEKGYHHETERLPMSELEAAHHLYHGGGLLPSDDNTITVIAGSTWGGGGTINWSASLQTQALVRKEWADRGMKFFTSADYQASLDRVCRRMGVSTAHIEHNHTNRVLLEGARKLGYSVKAVPQNTGGNKHYCGYCTLGCGAGQKQGPVVSWLPDAIKAGAKSIEGLEVDHVLFETQRGSKVATGVQGRWTSRDGSIKREVIVKAKKVVLSAGTLFSPLILLRSGLTNPQLGRNLKLHPAAFIFGIWPEEIRPWEGGILTAVCDEFQNQDGRFHGAKLEAMTMLPAWFLPMVASMGLEYKKMVPKFKHMSAFISLVRDRESGRVYPDAATGLPRVAYTPSPMDRQHCLEGMLAMAKICYVTGAQEIGVLVEGVPMFVRDTTPVPASASLDDLHAEDAGINDPAFQAWLDKVRATGLAVPEASFAT
ncbi:MAG: hypothetical protein M1838_004308, partial [Thelocarpon superellum]